MINESIIISPLSINKAFQGRRFKTKECKVYENCLWNLLPKHTMICGKIAVRYKFYLKNCARADYDNLIKVTQDIIVKKGWIEDDRKIYRAIIEKYPTKKDERIEVELKEIDLTD